MLTDKHNPWLLLKRAPLDEAAWVALAQAYSHHDQQWQLSYVLRQLSRLRSLSEDEILASLTLPKQVSLDLVESVLSRPTMEDAALRFQRLQSWLQQYQR